MYRWYRDCAVCSVYLADVPSPVILETFQKSRWFTRGWTLQELIAPTAVEFYSAEWREIGTKACLHKLVAEVTSISNRVLLDISWIQRLSVAERMSWAAKRKTTRIEDTAYCLLGPFNVNMPLLYGEGEHAFRRLQEEIIRRNEDTALLLWTPEASNDGEVRGIGALAAHPDQFHRDGQMLYDRARGVAVDIQWDRVRGGSANQLEEMLYHERQDYVAFRATLTKLLKESHDPPSVNSRGVKITLFTVGDAGVHSHDEIDRDTLLAWTLCFYKRHASEDPGLICIRLFSLGSPTFRLGSPYLEYLPGKSLSLLRPQEFSIRTVGEFSADPPGYHDLVLRNERPPLVVSLVDEDMFDTSTVDVWPAECELRKAPGGWKGMTAKPGKYVNELLVLLNLRLAATLSPNWILVALGLQPSRPGGRPVCSVHAAPERSSPLTELLPFWCTELLGRPYASRNGPMIVDENLPGLTDRSSITLATGQTVDVAVKLGTICSVRIFVHDRRSPLPREFLETALPDANAKGKADWTPYEEREEMPWDGSPHTPTAWEVHPGIIIGPDDAFIFPQRLRTYGINAVACVVDLMYNAFYSRASLGIVPYERLLHLEVSPTAEPEDYLLRMAQACEFLDKAYSPPTAAAIQHVSDGIPDDGSDENSDKGGAEGRPDPGITWTQSARTFQDDKAKNVLIACANGLSLSALIAASWLMKRTGRDVASVLEEVQGKAPEELQLEPD